MDEIQGHALLTGKCTPLIFGRKISDTVTTSDAILTQRRLAQQILDQQGDYLMIVKRNQGGLWEAIDVLFQEPPLPPDEEDRLSYTYTNTGHGRILYRTFYT